MNIPFERFSHACEKKNEMNVSFQKYFLNDGKAKVVSFVFVILCYFCFARRSVCIIVLPVYYYYYEDNNNNFFLNII